MLRTWASWTSISGRIHTATSSSRLRLMQKDLSTVGTWDIEASSIHIMVDEGWNQATYKPGDKITLVGHPMKNGSKGALLFYAIKDGKRLYRAEHRYESETE